VGTSPCFLSLRFYQLALGGVVVVGLALWRHGRRDAAGPAATGLAVGAAFLWIAGGAYSRAIAAMAGMPADDPQGAIQFLPGFQIALYLALWGAGFAATRWIRMVAGLAALVVTQTILLFTLHALAQSGIAANVRDVRAWAVVGPLLIFLLMQQPARSAGSERRAASTR